MSVENINLATIPAVRSAAVAVLAAAIEHPDGEDEYGRKAGQAIDDCILRLGIHKQTDDDTVTETIQSLAFEMEDALVKARLLPKEN